MDNTQADYAITRLYKDERLDGRLTVKRLQSFPKVLCRSISNLQQDVYSFSAVSFYFKKKRMHKSTKMDRCQVHFQCHQTWNWFNPWIQGFSGFTDAPKSNYFATRFITIFVYIFVFIPRKGRCSSIPLFPYLYKWIKIYDSLSQVPQNTAPSADSTHR